MAFDPEEEGKHDFFDGPDIEEAPPVPKRPAYKPEDPDYWDEGNDSEWEHLRPRSRLKLVLWAAAFIVFASACGFVWLRWFSPYADEGFEYGYVEHLERRGNFFKTYEGVLLPQKEMLEMTDTTSVADNISVETEGDTAVVYDEKFLFSVGDKAVYKALKGAMKDCRPVLVEYKRYHAVLPWRGESRRVVVKVDSAISNAQCVIHNAQ